MKLTASTASRGVMKLACSAPMLSIPAIFVCMAPSSPLVWINSALLVALLGEAMISASVRPARDLHPAAIFVRKALAGIFLVDAGCLAGTFPAGLAEIFFEFAGQKTFPAIRLQQQRRVIADRILPGAIAVRIDLRHADDTLVGKTGQVRGIGARTQAVQHEARYAARLLQVVHDFAGFRDSAGFDSLRGDFVGSARLAFSASMRSMILPFVCSCAGAVISWPSTFRWICSSMRERTSSL